MRISIIGIAELLLSACPVLCQNTGTDTPNDVLFSPGSAIPQQQWVGDVMQMYEPSATKGTDSSCCPLSPATYFCGSTNSTSLTSPPAHPAGVWGHDEGVSVQLLPAATDGSVLVFWGDSVTATNTSAAPTAYQVRTCDGGAPNNGTCLGVDTVSILSSAGASNLRLCTYLQDLDSYLLGNIPSQPAYTGGPGAGGTCPAVHYIVDTSSSNHHDGSSIPWAGFTYQWVTNLTSSTVSQCMGGQGGTVGQPLCAGEDMLLGHTATGAFGILDPDGLDTDLYVIYLAETQKRAGPSSLNFGTESILLYEDHANSTDPTLNPTPIGRTQMPYLTRAFTFSTLPNGFAKTTPIVGGTTVTRCSGNSTFFSNWGNPALWQGIVLSGQLYYISGSPSSSALTVTSTTLPSTTCTNPLPYSAIPMEGTGSGKFMYAAPEVLSRSLFDGSAFLNAGLPASLRSPGDTSDIVCFWGSDFSYRSSNVYLGCMDAAKSNIESAQYVISSVTGAFGLNNLSYLSMTDGKGGTGWALGDETQAVGLLTSFANQLGLPCVGELSVRWIAALNRFLMTYGSAACGGLWYRTAYAPWGPWSVESQFFPNAASSGWDQRLICQNSLCAADFNKEQAVFLTDPLSSSPINLEPSTPPYFQYGNPYGAYQYPGPTAFDNGDGTVSVFLNFSGYNNYVTWQLGARFLKAPAVRFSGKVRISPKLVVVP